MHVLKKSIPIKRKTQIKPTVKKVKRYQAKYVKSDIHAPLVKTGKIDGRKNLPQLFKKGEVRNPNGRPPAHKCIPDILRAVGQQPGSPDVIKMLQKHYPTIDISKSNALQVSMYMVYLQAQKGDDRAREFIANRTEGKLKEFISVADANVVVDIEGEDDAKIKKGEEIGIYEEVKTDDNSNTPSS